jgi:ATP-dependent Lon protease
MSEILLPLFPLKVVLFPRTEIPLHIFEERYKEMIGECLENGSEFGIVLVLEEGLTSTGCTASATKLIRKFEDGRMDILVRGQRRFELTGLDQEKSYLRGMAEFFDDEDAAPSDDDLRRQQAVQLFLQMSERLSTERSNELPEPAAMPEINDPQLSFQIASRLPVELAFRQTLLQMRSEADRLDRTISYLRKMAVRLTELTRAQAKAGSNGRSR